VYAAEYCEFKGFAMRILLLALLLASASVPYAFAQTKPEESRPLAASNPGPSTKPTPWQILDWSTYVKKCAAHYMPIRHSVSLTVTIGPDGLITGSPKIESPIDNDEFRDDVETVVAPQLNCTPADVTFAVLEPMEKVDELLVVMLHVAPELGEDTKTATSTAESRRT